MFVLSIIVPTFNSEKTLEQCLAAVRASSLSEYELIVADCASSDSTVVVAKKYADRVLELSSGSGRNQARIAAFRESIAPIIVNIDSDVIIFPDTLVRVVTYLSEHQDIDAITGILSTVHPNRDFFSQYKNLYMYYRFSLLPSSVHFLYGSIFAFRRPLAELYDQEFALTEDTAFGQNLVLNGKKISFLKDLEVVHLKKYGFFSLLRNDFLISANLVSVFLKYRGWHCLLGAKKFAHSSLGQIYSLLSASTVCVFFVSYVALNASVFFLCIAAFLWVLCNVRFFHFLNKEKGFIFVSNAFFITFLTDLAKAAGIVCGACVSLLRRLRAP